MKKTCIMFLCVLFLLPQSAFAAESRDTDKNVRAKSAVLMCLDTGEVLYSKNEKEHLSPASVTKIMSILLVLEALESKQISLQDKVTASANAVKMGGSQIWLEVGETMTVDELLKAVVIASANDACTALGEYVGGSATGFVKMMNERAAQLGCENTNFENSNGLDDTVTNHYSCAYDLALITREVMKHDMITDYTTVWLDSLRGGKTELNNTNKLVNSYSGITGLKTGTTSNAGFCIVATAKRDDMHLAAVVLGSETSEERFDTATYLLDWGFANYRVITPEIDEGKITPVKIRNGVFKEVKPVVRDANKIVVQAGSKDVAYDYHLKKSVEAPLHKNDVLGEITVKSGDKRIGTLRLVSPNDIQRVSIGSIFKDMLIKL